MIVGELCHSAPPIDRHRCMHVQAPPVSGEYARSDGPACTPWHGACIGDRQVAHREHHSTFHPLAPPIPGGDHYRWLATALHLSSAADAYQTTWHVPQVPT
jgi:hypothetical protein